MKIDKHNYLKDRHVCKSCYIKNRRKSNNRLIQNQNITSIEQPKIENVNITKSNVDNPSVSAHDNHACVVIGPRNVGKTYYVLKRLKKHVTKDLFI